MALQTTENTEGQLINEAFKLSSSRKERGKREGEKERKERGRRKEEARMGGRGKG